MVTDDYALNSFTFSSNGFNIGRPLKPEREILIHFEAATPFIRPISPGKLGHHLLTLTTEFWGKEDNAPITEEKRFRESDFLDVLTRVVPNTRSQRMTPTNVAWGFWAMSKLIFLRLDWHEPNYNWLLYGQLIGSTSTRVTPQLSQLSNTTDARLTRLDVNETVLDAPVRTQFTGTPIPVDKFLMLTRQLLEEIWSFRQIAPARDPSVTINYPDGNIVWKMRFDYFDHWVPENSVTYGAIANRVLRMLQLPAYLDRWETVQSDFYLEGKLFGLVKISKEDAAEDPVTSSKSIIAS